MGGDSEPAQVGSTVASVGRAQLGQGHRQDQRDPADRHVACGRQGLEDSGGVGRVLLGPPSRAGDRGTLARLTATASTQGSRGLPAGFARVSPAVLDGRRVRPFSHVPRSPWSALHTRRCDARHAPWGCTLHHALRPRFFPHVLRIHLAFPLRHAVLPPIRRRSPVVSFAPGAPCGLRHRWPLLPA